MTRGNNILKRIDLNLGRFLVKAAWCVILSVAMGCILMISVYLLPTDRIRDNIISGRKGIKTPSRIIIRMPHCI